jgi:hypothetical protein
MCTNAHGSDITLTLGTRESIWLRRVEPQRVVMLMNESLRSIGSPISSARLCRVEIGITISWRAAKKWMMKMKGAH